MKYMTTKSKQRNFIQSLFFKSSRKHVTFLIKMTFSLPFVYSTKEPNWTENSRFQRNSSPILVSSSLYKKKVKDRVQGECQIKLRTARKEFRSL